MNMKTSTSFDTFKEDLNKGFTQKFWADPPKSNAEKVVIDLDPVSEYAQMKSKHLNVNDALYDHYSNQTIITVPGDVTGLKNISLAFQKTLNIHWKDKIVNLFNRATKVDFEVNENKFEVNENKFETIDDYQDLGFNSE